MISVIVPVYNAESYLDICIQSICRNSYRDLEIICIDDGSKDSSAVILKKWAQVDSRIIIVTKEQTEGPSAARNTGLDVSKGEWIAFIDADDAVNEIYFEVLLEAYDENRAQASCVICGRVGYQDEYLGLKMNSDDNRRERMWRSIEPDEFCLSMHYWTFVWGRIYRRELISTFRNPEDLIISEDVYFNLSVLLSAGYPKIISANAAVYYYRWNPTSLTHIKDGNQTFRKLHTYERLINDVKNFPHVTARSIVAQVLAKETFVMYCSSRAVGPKIAHVCRDLFISVLNMWKESGFLSRDSQLLYLKFYLYRINHNFAKIETLYRQARAMLRLIKRFVKSFF